MIDALLRERSLYNLCVWLMCSDNDYSPQRSLVLQDVEVECRAMGYNSWTDFYHRYNHENN